MPRSRTTAAVSVLLIGLAVAGVAACDPAPSPSPSSSAGRATVAATQGPSADPDATADPTVVALLERVRATETQGFAFVRDLGQAPSGNATGEVLGRMAAWVKVERAWIAANPVPECAAEARQAYSAAVEGMGAGADQFRALFNASPRPGDAAFMPALQAYSNSLNTIPAVDALAAAAVRSCRGGS